METAKFDDSGASQVFSYKGEITPDFTRDLLKNLESLLHMRSATPRFRRNVFTVVNESLHNIEKYGLQDCEPTDLPSLMIVNSGKGYIFTIENSLSPENLSDFRDKLAYLNSAEITELRSAYLKQLFRDSGPDGHSAGLGLLAIAIRSNKQVEYSFTESGSHNMRVKLVITTDR
ncbi:MAG: DUF6272 family protein [Bacteroidota bacterium]